MELEHGGEEVTLIGVSSQILRSKLLFIHSIIVVAANNRLPDVAGTADDDSTEASGAFLDSLTLPPRAVAAKDYDDDDEDNQTGGDGNSCLDIDLDTPELEKLLIVPLSRLDGLTLPISPFYSGVDTTVTSFDGLIIRSLTFGEARFCRFDESRDFRRRRLLLGLTKTNSRRSLSVAIIT